MNELLDALKRKGYVTWEEGVLRRLMKVVNEKSSYNRCFFYFALIFNSNVLVSVLISVSATLGGRKVANMIIRHLSKFV